MHCLFLCSSAFLRAHRNPTTAQTHFLNSADTFNHLFATTFGPAGVLQNDRVPPQTANGPQVFVRKKNSLLAGFELLDSTLEFLNAIKHLLFFLPGFALGFCRRRKYIQEKPEHGENQRYYEEPQTEIPSSGTDGLIRFQTFGALPAFVAPATRYVCLMSALQNGSIHI